MPHAEIRDAQSLSVLLDQYIQGLSEMTPELVR
jgi:hypothetical protein